MNNTFAQVLRVGGVIAVLTVGTFIVTGSIKTPISDGQVVVSDHGFLVGDTGLTFNTSTNALTVGSCVGCGGGSSAVPQLTEVINAGATATSTPNFSMGLTATTGTFITASTTKLTVAGTLDANNITATGTMVAQGTIQSIGQVRSDAGGTAFFAGGGGSARMGNGTVGGTAGYNFGTDTSAGGTYDSVNDIVYWQNANAKIGISSTSTIFDVGALVPTSTNVTDVGIDGKGFRNVYASGTLYLGKDLVLRGIATETNDNALCITTTSTVKNAGNTTCVTSALRFKTNIEQEDGIGLDQILGLNPVTFNKVTDDPNSPLFGKRYFSVIAEDAAKADPKLGSYNTFTGEIQTLDVHAFIGAFVNSIKTLFAKITGLEARLDQQQREIDDLRKQIQALK